MTKVIDIKAELARLPFLEGRGKDPTEAEARAAFTTLSPYRDGGIADDHAAPQSFEMTAGMMTVIPQGCWHLFRAPVGVTVMTITPQPTQHLPADDPRSVALFARLSASSQQ